MRQLSVASASSQEMFTLTHSFRDSYSFRLQSAELCQKRWLQGLGSDISVVWSAELLMWFQSVLLKWSASQIAASIMAGSCWLQITFVANRNLCLYWLDVWFWKFTWFGGTKDSSHQVPFDRSLECRGCLHLHVSWLPVSPAFWRRSCIHFKTTDHWKWISLQNHIPELIFLKDCFTSSIIKY